MSNELTKVDHSALRLNQLVIIALSVVAFVFNLPGLVLLVGLVMAAGTLLGVPGFIWLYRYIFKPLGLLRPHVLPDNAEPHRFAQGFGAVVMLFAALALFAGQPVIGWALVWMVAALAALNAFAGFCVGCMIYYWLARLGAPGFIKSPPDGVLPGMRPRLQPVEVERDA